MLLGVFAGMITPAWLWPDQSINIVVAYDKWIHGLVFVILSLWFSGQYAPRAYWRIAAGLAVFGAVIELIQRSLAYRTGDFGDLYANLAGIAVGLVVAALGAGGWSLRVERWLEARQTAG